MGLFLTLLYILTAYLAPVTIFGPIAEYRVELFLAALTLFVSVTKIPGSGLFSGVQAYALPALVLSTALSIAGNGWLGGAAGAMLGFIPNVIVFYFIALNCTQPKHLKWLVVVLLGAAVFIIAHARYDMLVGDPYSLYLMEDSNAAGETFYRIRGLALVSDPNDLAQFLVAMVPCAFFLWRKDSGARNAFLVYLPVLVLGYGLYLTHSRGGMLALLAMMLLAIRPRIGTIPAALVAGISFVAFTALGWSGGRAISADSGSDRLDAWFTGLTLLRAHPLIGVGLGHFQDYYEITAHNTIVVCSAEVGLIGFFWWMMFVLPSVRDAIAGSRVPSASTNKADAYETDTPEPLARESSMPYDLDPDPGSVLYLADLPTSPTSPVLIDRFDSIANRPWFHEDFRTREQADLHALDAAESEADLSSVADESEVNEQEENAEEVRRLCRLMLLSISGFLAAGWFLSRAFVLSLFLLGGMISTVYRITTHYGAAPPLSFARAARFSAFACAGALTFVYVLLRVASIIHH